MVTRREDRRDHAIEDPQRSLGRGPLRLRILVAVATASADSDVVLLHEVALVHDQADVPSLAMLLHPFRHQLEVCLVLGILRVVLRIREDRNRPTGARTSRWVDKLRRFGSAGRSGEERRGQQAFDQVAAGERCGGAHGGTMASSVSVSTRRMGFPSQPLSPKVSATGL